MRRQIRLLTSMLTPKRLALVEACAIGVVSGLAAWILKEGSGWLGTIRVRSSVAIADWLVLPLMGLVGGYLSGWLIERFAPDAGGSGLPQVKAALARHPTNLSLRLAAIKLVSTIVVLGSGLTLGRQGPTVHIGAALAGWLSRWVPTSPEFQRQTIAAGAAAGLAAGFNAPITGVLFVVEELLHDVSSLTLGTAILSSFVGAVVSRLLGGQNWDLNLELAASQAYFVAPAIPFAILVGLLAGLFGGLFNRGILASSAWVRQHVRLSLPMRIAIAGCISGIVLILLPVQFRDNTGLREFLIAGDAGIGIIAIAFATKFCLTLLAYASGAPGGLFAPTLILGSAIGSLVGWISSTWFGVGDPTTFALAGMGAFFCAVAKVPITAIAIVFEMTADFNLVLPLMLASVMAYLVSERVSPGSLYDRLLALKGIDLSVQTQDLTRQLGELKAEDVMQQRVETLDRDLTLKEVREIFSRSHHRGFPVVDSGKLIGIFSQADLLDASKRQVAPQTPITEVMTPRPIAIDADASLEVVLYLLERHKISRLPVTEGRRLLGIITRSDIIKAESDRLKTANPDRATPSYLVYQTRDPAVGKGRLLVPLSNPKNTVPLLRLAVTLARDRDYEIEAFQAIVIPRHLSPHETRVKTTAARRLLNEAERTARAWGVPIHTQVRVVHDVAEGILEIVRDRHIDILLMGWSPGKHAPGQIFGSVTDTLIDRASCELVLVKWGATQYPLDRWLVPVSGGPNVKEALHLLPVLMRSTPTSMVKLCQVFYPGDTIDREALDEATRELEKTVSCHVVGTPVVGSSVTEAVLEMAEKYNYDAIVLGATRQGLLRRAVTGNIPETIAKRSDRTVILVRTPSVESPNG